MKLKNELYIIKNIENNSCRIELLRDSRIYKAHFPEQPITPGVCIIQIATELLTEIHGVNFELSKVSNAKFLAVINPDYSKEVTYNLKKITINEEDNSAKVSVEVTDKEIVFAKLSLVYKIYE